MNDYFIRLKWYVFRVMWRKALRAHTGESRVPQFILIHQILRHFDPILFTRRFNDVGNKEVFLTFHSSIDLLLSDINSKLQLIQQKRYFPSDSYVDCFEVVIKNFFISGKKEYLDVFTSYRALREKALQLCQVLETMQTSEDGYEEYVVRHCSRILLSLERLLIGMSK